MVIIGVKDAQQEIVGVPDQRIGETLDVILRAVRQMIKPELVLDYCERYSKIEPDATLKSLVASFEPIGKRSALMIKQVTCVSRQRSAHFLNSVYNNGPALRKGLSSGGFLSDNLASLDGLQGVNIFL